MLHDAASDIVYDGPRETAGEFADLLLDKLFPAAVHGQSERDMVRLDIIDVIVAWEARVNDDIDGDR